jgi:hypothetical protein
VVTEPDICTLVLVTLSEQVAEVPPPVRAGRSALELRSKKLSIQYIYLLKNVLDYI